MEIGSGLAFIYRKAEIVGKGIDFFLGTTDW